MLNFFKTSALSQELKQRWDADGYLILKKFISPKTIAAVNTEISDLLSGKKVHGDVTIDVLSGPHAGKLYKVATAPADALKEIVKVNDLFLESPTIRSCNLDKKLAAILSELLDGDPLVCNSLNFIYGSSQPAHYDTWFMPPTVENKMLATSICLDPVTDDNGPVFLYPGSHKIPPYVFPHGHIAKLGADLAPAEQYVRETTAHIEPVLFRGEPGDVLIWHGQLLHGGSPIKDPGLTRRSLVSHYFRAEDLAEADRQMITPRTYIMKRPHRHVH